MGNKTSPDLENEAELRGKIAAGSQDPEDYNSLAGHCFEAGDFEGAITVLQQALRLPLTNFQKARMSWNLASLFHELGKQDQAITHAKIARELFSSEPDNVEVLFFRGMTESILADCMTDADASANAARSGLQWFNRLMTEAPDFEDLAFAYIHAARLNNVLGNSREAVALYERCLQRDLDQRERFQCLLGLAEALRRENRFKEAEDALTEALNLAEAYRKEELPQVYFILGLIQRSSGRPVEAKETFQRVLLELKNHPYLHSDLDFFVQINQNLGEVAYELGDHKEAINTFQKVLAHYPEDDLGRRSALLWLGQSYHGMGSLTDARDCYNQVLNSPRASETEKASIQQDLGKVYYDMGCYDEAIDAFQKGLAYFTWNDSSYGDTLIWVGSCYDAKGEHERARGCFEEVTASSHASEAQKSLANRWLAHLPPPDKKIVH